MGKKMFEKDTYEMGQLPVLATPRAHFQPSPFPHMFNLDDSKPLACLPTSARHHTAGLLGKLSWRHFFFWVNSWGDSLDTFSQLHVLPFGRIAHTHAWSVLDCSATIHQGDQGEPVNWTLRL
jgi:hypothetical protein